LVEDRPEEKAFRAEEGGREGRPEAAGQMKNGWKAAGNDQKAEKNVIHVSQKKATSFV
jgi:hypothetical protein